METPVFDTIRCICHAAGPRRSRHGARVGSAGTRSVRAHRRLSAAPRTAALRSFRDAAGERIDQGLLLYFPAPNSYTGEDVIELQGHGGPMVLSLLLQAAAQPAHGRRGPASFPSAPSHGCLDLAQAEAVATHRCFQPQRGARCAAFPAGRILQPRAGPARRADRGARRLEAALDFADEDVPGSRRRPCTTALPAWSKSPPT